MATVAMTIDCELSLLAQLRPKLIAYLEAQPTSIADDEEILANLATKHGVGGSIETRPGPIMEVHEPLVSHVRRDDDNGLPDAVRFRLSRKRAAVAVVDGLGVLMRLYGCDGGE
eukprot:SAG11_NODE_890_length_6689_cov_18.947951_10_plen_114_part_00